MVWYGIVLVAKFDLNCVFLYNVIVCMIRNQFDYVSDFRIFRRRLLCVGLLCVASIRYLSGLNGNFEIYYFHV